MPCLEGLRKKVIKFLDLPLQYREIQREIDSAIFEVLQKGEFVGGEFVQRFQDEFAQEVGSEFALGVGNGTDAIEIALRAMDLPSQSEVILPVNTFFGSLEGVVNAGLKPVFVDCGEDYCIDVSLIEQAITSKTSAIMPVHLYGRMCEMQEILSIAQRFDLKIIEDCAQSFGAKIKINGELKTAGSIGDVACFSFYPGKNLGAYGDGGAITTSDKDLFNQAYSLANHGIRKNKYEHLQIGRNSRLDGMQANILRAKLKFIHQWNERRRDCAKIYQDLLSPYDECLKLPSMEGDSRNVWHLYVVRLEGKMKGKREELLEFLKEHEIECGIHYPFVLQQDHNSRALQWSKEILSLPIGEHLGQEEIEKVCEILESFIKSAIFG